MEEARQQLLDYLNYLYRGVLNIEKLSGQKENIKAQINELGNRISSEETRRDLGMTGAGLNVNKGKNTVGKVLLIIGAIIIGFLFLLVKLILSFAGVSAADGIGLYLIVGFLAFVVLMIVLIVRGVTGAIGNTIVRSSANSVPKAQFNINAYNDQIKNLLVQLPAIDSKIAVSYSYIADLLQNFPPDYCYSEAIGKCIFYIRNLRADTLKEALNMYADECYKDAMLLEQKKQTAYARISAAANVQTAYNTGRIADYTKDISNSARQIAYNTDVIRANTEAMAAYSAQTAYNTAATSMYTRNIRDRVCPSFWD
jgi:hypothetical protein